VKAVRLHDFHEMPRVDEVPEPVISGPFDVIVRVGGAGVCRTDLHIIEGQWDAAMGTPLPYILGHENAGWVHEVGSAVTNVAVGDTVILHPTPTCGLCRACRAGDDMHCVASTFPGLSTDGGMAQYLLTSARACVRLDPATRPEDVAALADAGITAYHAVRKAVPLLYPGTTAVVIGAGGLGHIGIQCLAALTAARIVVVDRNPDALKLAEQLGAEATIVADGRQVTAVADMTGGRGADVVLDFVAEQGAEADGWQMTAPGGSYFVIGYGGTLHLPTLDIISTERNVIGNIVGTYNDLAELMALAHAGRVTLHTRTYPLDAAADALADLDAGRVRGRAILVPLSPGGRPPDPRSGRPGTRRLPSPLLPRPSVAPAQSRRHGATPGPPKRAPWDAPSSLTSTPSFLGRSGSVQTARGALPEHLRSLPIWPKNCASALRRAPCCWPELTSWPRR